MSIFKDTLKPFIQDQLTARQRIVSQQTNTGFGITPRDDKFLRFVAGKNAWVKMQSFVNTYDPDTPNKKGLAIGRYRYWGDGLAKKYVLEGGTLFESKKADKDGNLRGTGKFTLREGVGKRSGVYASDIDLGGDRPLGYRPMPGITSININNKSAYGSLREATVKFYAWDKHQLEELELLYMRTGYSVLLEWGWSQYLQSGKVTTNDKNETQYTPNLDNISIKNFDDLTIDIFSDKEIFNPPADFTSDEIIYGKIEYLNQKTNGNYDAMLGYVKNFSWQLMDNGGFECTTVLISRGEVISSLKISSNNPSFINDPISYNVGDSPPLSLFENIFLNYSALINDSELTSLETESGGIKSGRFGQFASGSNPITKFSVDQLYNDLKSRIDESPLYIINANQNLNKFNNSLKKELYPDDGNRQNFGKILLTEGNIDGVGIEYIKMDYLIALLNLYFNFKDAKNKTISQIILPGDTPCLASIDSVSIDPGTCIIYNNKATFITGLEDGALPKTYVYKTDTGTSYVDEKDTVSSEQFLNSQNLGKIGNIYVAIPKIIEIYRSKGSSTTDVSLIDFMKSLLEQISKALGGINDFSLHTTKSTVQIIDIKYLEQGAGKTKYEFDLLGLKSICRDVKITSRVFESQSSMMAIAAQSRANVGDLYSSTQNHFNKGLKDRILFDKLVWRDKQTPTYYDELRKIFTNLISLQNYTVVKCLGSFDNRTIVYPKPEEVSNASSVLKTLLLQLNGQDVNFKAIIPFELEIVLDGIAGLVQGQIFKVNENILPDRYAKSNIGFIITGLSHDLSNNDWKTTVKTQMCILDNELLTTQDEKDQIAKLKEDLKKLVERRNTNAIVWSCIADYMTQLSMAAYGSLSEPTPNGWLKLGTIALALTPLLPAAIVLNNYNNAPQDPNDKKTYQNLINNLQKSGIRFYNHPTNGNDADKMKLTYENNAGVVKPNIFKAFFEPDMNNYFNNVWFPEAKKKATGDFLTRLNELANDSDPTKGDAGKIRAVAQLDSGAVVTLPFSIENVNKFLSYPSAYKDDLRTIVKDSFMFRSPDYVNFVGQHVLGEEGDKGSLPYPFPPDALIIPNNNTPDKGIFIKVTEDSEDKYYYKFPLVPGTKQLDAKLLFKIWYKYIYDSKFFSQYAAEFQPSMVDLASGNVFSIYN